MRLLTKEEVDSYIQEADGLRTDYINSDRYVGDLCDTIFQHLNLKGNEYDNESFYKFQTEIEFLALYQQLIDVYPEAFSVRKQELIKDSLQKSIYASIRPQLSPNYITELENNHPDSFLIIPSNLETAPSPRGLHGVALILRKENNKITVSIYDKAEDRKEYTIEGVGAHVPTTYRYTIKDTETNVNIIANILYLGLGYPTGKNQALMNELMKSPNSLYTVFAAVAQEEKMRSHMAMGQFFHANCSINNLNGALKYILGKEYLAKDLRFNDEIAVKTKYKDLSTEKYNSIIVQIVLTHLIKLESCPESTYLLNDAYGVYHLLKKTRSKNTEELDKFEEKVELSKYLHLQNREYIGLVPAIPIGHPVRKEELGSLYKLSKEEINYIRKQSNHLLKNPGQPVSKSTISKITEVHEGILLERNFKDILTR